MLRHLTVLGAQPGPSTLGSEGRPSVPAPDCAIGSQGPATRLCCAPVLLLGTGHRKALCLLPPGSSKKAQSAHLASNHWSRPPGATEREKLVPTACVSRNGRGAPTCSHAWGSVCCRAVLLSVGLDGPCRVQSCTWSLPTPFQELLESQQACMFPQSGALPGRATETAQGTPVLEASCPCHPGPTPTQAQSKSTGFLPSSSLAWLATATFHSWETSRGRPNSSHQPRTPGVCSLTKSSHSAWGPGCKNTPGMHAHTFIQVSTYPSQAASR